MAAFLHFSTAEVESGLSYAQREYHVCLNREMLKSLADRTGILWYANGRRPNGLANAKRTTLIDLWEKHRIDQERRNAYSSAISHMFGLRSAELRKHRKRVALSSRAPEPGAYGFNDAGQGVFLFPRAQDAR